MSWTLGEAVILIRDIERICPAFGCHVALTGGVLYKNGERKDLDILIYRIRQRDKIDVEGLFKALDEQLRIKKVSGFGWCFKLTRDGKRIDLFDPEESDGEEYPEP